MLDFLKSPQWQIIKKDYINYDKIKTIEEDYWWIDENEVSPELVTPTELYKKCLQSFIEIAQKAGYLNKPSELGAELIPVGEKVVFEALYDRYLVSRHESDPDIFYDYVLQLSIEAGMAISHKWFSDQINFEAYVDKIIRETSFDDIGLIYKKYLHLKTDSQKFEFIDKFSSALYELLKWYYPKDDFETYKLKAFLAAFYLGVTIIAEKQPF